MTITNIDIPFLRWVFILLKVMLAWFVANLLIAMVVSAVSAALMLGLIAIGIVTL